MNRTVVSEGREGSAMRGTVRVDIKLRFLADWVPTMQALWHYTDRDRG